MTAHPYQSYLRSLRASRDPLPQLVTQMDEAQSQALDLVERDGDLAAVYDTWLCFRDLFVAGGSNDVGTVFDRWWRLDQSWPQNATGPKYPDDYGLLLSFATRQFDGLFPLFQHRLQTSNREIPSVPGGEWPWRVRLLRALHAARGEELDDDALVRLFTSCSTHFHILFGNVVRRKGFGFLGHQLGEFARAIECQTNELFDPADMPPPEHLGASPDSLPEGAGDRARVWAEFMDLMTVLCHLDDEVGEAQGITGFHTISLTTGGLGALESAFAEEWAKLDGPSVPTPLIRDILRYWMSRAPWIDPLLRRFRFEPFDEQTEALHVGRLPAPHGCDLYVLVAGARRVGKTHFMLASEAVHDASDSPARLIVDHADGVEGRVDQIREKWREHVPFPTTEDSVFAVRESVGMCRFRFFDFPGEYFESAVRPDDLMASPAVRMDGGAGYVNPVEGAKGSPQYAMRALRQIRNQMPSALIMVIDRDMLGMSPTDPKWLAYRNIATVMQSVAKETGVSIDEIPVLFLLTKADKIAESLQGPDTDERHLNRMLDFLDARVPISEGFRFFVSQSASFDAVLQRVERNRSVIGSPAFHLLLRGDIESLRHSIDWLIALGFRTFAFSYVSCLYNDAADPHETPGVDAYPTVHAVWHFLTRWLSVGTIESRRDYLRRYFDEDVSKRLERYEHGGGLERETLAAKASRVRQVPAAIRDGQPGARGRRKKPSQLTQTWEQLVAYMLSPEAMSHRHVNLLDDPALRSMLWGTVEREKGGEAGELERYAAVVGDLLTTSLWELGVPDRRLTELESQERNGLRGDESARVAAAAMSPGDVDVLLDITVSGQQITREDFEDKIQGVQVAYDFRQGSLSTLCIYRDRPLVGPEFTLAGPMAHERARDILLRPGVDMADKIRLLLVLRGYALPTALGPLGLKRFEIAETKIEVLKAIYPRILQGDVYLMRAIRHSVDALAALRRWGGIGQVGKGGRALADHLVSVLTAAGWQAPKFSESAEEVNQTLFTAVKKIREIRETLGKVDMLGREKKRRRELLAEIADTFHGLYQPHRAMAVADLDAKTVGNRELLYLEGEARAAMLCCQSILDLVAEEDDDAPAEEEGANDFEILRAYPDRVLGAANEYLAVRGETLAEERATYLERSGWLRDLGGEIEYTPTAMMDPKLARPRQRIEILSRAVNHLVRKQQYFLSG